MRITDDKSLWTPVLRGAIYCSPACGGGCKKADFDFATAEAEALVRRLGPGTENNYSFVQEFPLSNKLKAMSRVFKSTDSSLKIFTKGAPEDVFKLCQLSNDDQKKYHTAINAYGLSRTSCIGSCESGL